MYRSYNTYKSVLLIFVITLGLSYKIASYAQSSNVVLSKRLMTVGLILFGLVVYETLGLTNPNRLAPGSVSFLGLNAFSYTLIYQTIGTGKSNNIYFNLGLVYF